MVGSDEDGRRPLVAYDLQQDADEPINDGIPFRA